MPAFKYVQPGGFLPLVTKKTEPIFFFYIEISILWQSVFKNINVNMWTLCVDAIAGIYFVNVMQTSRYVFSCIENAEST